MESRSRSVLLAIVATALVVGCCIIVAAGAAIAGGLVGWPFGWTAGGGIEGARLDRTYRVGDSPSLKIENFAGNVTVRAGEGGVIRVVATKRAPLATNLDRIKVSVVEQGDGLRVKTEKPLGMTNASVVLEITTPAGADLDLQTGSGTVEIQGLRGGVTAHTGSGSMVVRNLSGEVDVSTGSGSVNGYDITGSLKASTGSGGVRIDGLTGELEASTGSGGIEVRAASGPVRLETGSGGIEYQGSPEASCRFDTGSGGIGLSLPADLDARVDLHTGSGRVELGFAVDGQISRRDVEGVIGSGEDATLYAETGSGDIELRRQ